jgi:hypothetical protein
MRRCGLRVVVFKVFDDEMVVCRSDINHGDTHCGWRIADAFVVVRAEALLVRLEPFTMRAMAGHVVRHRVQAPMRFFQLLFFREQLQPLRLEFGVRHGVSLRRIERARVGYGEQSVAAFTPEIQRVAGAEHHAHCVPACRAAKFRRGAVLLRLVVRCASLVEECRCGQYQEQPPFP